MLLRECSQPTHESVNVRVQNAERIPYLKNESGVVDVLARRAPMDKPRRLVIVFRDERGELFDQRNCGIERQRCRG